MPDENFYRTTDDQLAFAIYHQLAFRGMLNKTNWSIKEITEEIFAVIRRHRMKETNK